ncbi:MAG: DUF559 domain-containing protein [Actinomycetota bacterium]|nr:MAG: DUF559 domain-containing protein [Actinomycetota bacterium]
MGHDHAGANRVTLFVPRHADVRRGARSDLLVRATNLPRRQRDTRLGVPTTSLLRTAVDLARGQPLPSALVPLDAALRQWILRLSDSQRGSANSALEAASVPRARATDELAAIIATMARLPGIRAVRRAAEDVDPKAETPLESLSRGRFLAAGLPRPVAQLAVHGDDGRTYRSDLGWPQYRVLGEADGALKYVDRADLLREKEREDSLRRAGWIVVRWTWDEILRRPEVVVRRILAALNSYLTAQPLRSHRKG